MTRNHILVVDDNEAFLDSVKDVLEINDFNVTTATSGPEAISLTEKQDFNVVLMDVKMSGMNGVESFIEIKKHNPDLPVIMITAYSMKSLVRQALDEGAKAVLSKPLDIPLLLDRIRDAQKSGDGRLILVAEDDMALCDNLSKILQQEGFRVISACNGEEVLKKMDKQPFDIMLLDMKLPIMNGLEVLRRVKATRPGVVAVLISGYAREMNDIINQALEESAHTFMEKPLDVEKLLLVLKEINYAMDSGSYEKPGKETI